MNKTALKHGRAAAVGVFISTVASVIARGHSWKQILIEVAIACVVVGISWLLAEWSLRRFLKD